MPTIAPDGYCDCWDCRKRHEAEHAAAEKGLPDPETDALTMSIVRALDAPKATRVERAEALALLLMERIKAERAHHEAEHHGYTD